MNIDDVELEQSQGIIKEEPRVGDYVRHAANCDMIGHIVEIDENRVNKYLVEFEGSSTKLYYNEDHLIFLD